MPCISGKHKKAAGRIRGHGVTVEFVAEADGEDAGNDRVDAIFRMPMRHRRLQRISAPAGAEVPAVFGTG
jgi:hypothetical protein